MSMYQDGESMHPRELATAEREDPQDEKRRLAAAHTRRAHAALVLTARNRVHDVAYELAKQGLSAETIREALLDMATTGADMAALYIARYDREEQARADDLKDDDDRREMRDEAETAWEQGHT